jgi:diacylglycerol kinase family enzyme
VFAVLLNPASGGAGHPHLREDVEALFHDARMETHVHELVARQDIAAAARAALNMHPRAIVAGGGDGTVSAVASALAGTETALGVLPLGTLNHFAKDSGIPLDLPKAVQTVVAGHTKRVDVGRVNDAMFVNNSSIGVYPSFVEARDRLRKQGHSKWSAPIFAMADVLRREGEVAIRLHADRSRVVARTPFVFVGNNEYRVEGFRLGGRMRLDGGRLHAYFAPPVRTRHLPKLFAQAVFGYARREHALETMTGAELWVDTIFRRSIDVACDGEIVTLDTPLHYRSWPGALSVLVPAT